MKLENEKQQAKLKHIANWYHGTICIRCAHMDDKDGAKDCYDKMMLIINDLNSHGVEKMKHAEFVKLIKNTKFCKPIKRIFEECKICKACGIRQWP